MELINIKQWENFYILKWDSVHMYSTTAQMFNTAITSCVLTLECLAGVGTQPNKTEQTQQEHQEGWGEGKKA